MVGNSLVGRTDHQRGRAFTGEDSGKNCSPVPCCSLRVTAADLELVEA
jgi:hypothetical protein